MLTSLSCMYARARYWNRLPAGFGGYGLLDFLRFIVDGSE